MKSYRDVGSPGDRERTRAAVTVQSGLARVLASEETRDANEIYDAFRN